MATRDVTNSDASETALMNVREFVADLRRRGMKVWAEAEHIVIEPDALTEADVAAIVTNKPAILAYLRAETARSSQPLAEHERRHDHHVNNDDDETGYRGLMSPELGQALSAVLGTFPGAQLLGVAPNPRPGKSWVELEGAEQPPSPGQLPANPQRPGQQLPDSQLPDQQLPLELKVKSVVITTK